MAATVPRFLREQFFGKCPPPTISLAGRVIVVTGSNTGLGLETVIHLAKLNPAKIIIACRSVSKGESGKTTVEKTTGFKNVEVWALDLSNYSSIFAFVQRCEGLDRLDSFVANAGVSMMTWEESREGWEMTLQVNVISTGLLGLLILPILERTAKMPSPNTQVPFKPHLTITGSAVHVWAEFPEKTEKGSILKKMNEGKAAFEKGSVTQKLDRYNTSKLFDLFIAHKIANLPEASSVIVNVVHPGLCTSELGRQLSGFENTVLGFVSRSSVKGAANIAWAAVSDTSSTPGAYVSCSSVKLPSKWSTSKEGLQIEEKVWRELCEEWTRVVPDLKHTLTL